MKKLLLFFAALAAADRLLGHGLDALYRRALTGESGGLINLALREDADALVLGSSRAVHHLSPPVLTRALGLKAFNAGVDGQDFLYAMMLLDVWTARHGAPRLVLLHVDPMSLRRSPEELRRAAVFSPFVDRSALAREILYSRGRYERLKHLSYCYRYNGKLLAVLKNALARPAPGFDGFLPLEPGVRKHGQALEAVDAAVRLKDSGEALWDRKLALFDRLDAYCRAHRARLVLVHSPLFAPDAAAERRWRAQLAPVLASHPGVLLIDGPARYAGVFEGRRDLFIDASHLNARGAAMFTALVAREIRAKRWPELRKKPLAAVAGGL